MSASSSKDTSLSDEYEITSCTTLEEEIVDDPVAEQSSDLEVVDLKPASNDRSSQFVRPAYIPPHVMGRSLDNPASDHTLTGRRIQKPRLGVKVPYRNLTSQIVTQDEIAQELFERSRRKYSYSDASKNSDQFFAMKLTHRLATKMSINEKQDLGGVGAKPATAANTPSIPDKKLTSLKKRIEKTTETMSEKVDEIFAEISNTLTEEMKISLSDSSDSAALLTNNTVQQYDNASLLAILEEGDDSSESISAVGPVAKTPASPSEDSTKQSKLSRKQFRRNLDPETERELALQQLKNFPSKRRPRKKKIDSRPFVSSTPKGAFKRSCYSYNLNTTPKLFPKKYQRNIKRQMRNSKTNHSDQPSKRIPDVPEVQIAIDNFIKTYTNKRKQRLSMEEAAPVAAAENSKPDAEEITQPPSEAATSNGYVVPPTTEKETEKSTEDAEEESSSDEADEDESTCAPPTNSRAMREINRLLGDEGAINMIYSLQSKRMSRSGQSGADEPPNKRKKNLLQKQMLVKSAVLGINSSSSQNSSSEASRTRRSHPQQKRILKQTAPVLFPPPISKTSLRNVTRRAAAEDSIIIRRHSYSSAYSSDDECTNAGDISSMSQNSTTQDLKSSGSPRKLSQHAKVNGGPSSRESPDDAGVNNESLKDLTVMKYEKMAHIILSTSSIKMKNALNADILREFTGILKELENDDECMIVLVTSSAESFCEGLELESMICDDAIERSTIAGKYVNAVLEFTKCLSHFSKLLVAGVNGSCIGLGVAMLPFFDLVYASNRASFKTPYLQLGQIPEAGAVTTLPRLVGRTVANELLFGHRRLTCNEALKCGLVTKKLSSEYFEDELLAVVDELTQYSRQSMKTIKLLMHQELISELEKKMVYEVELLREQWSSDECQKQFKNYLAVA